MIEDEKFFAWLDGELSADESAAVQLEVAADPRLRKLAEQHRSLRAGIKGAFDQVAAAPVPERLREALRSPAPEVVDLGAVRRTRASRYLRPLGQWAAVAAVLAVGILVGTIVQQRSIAPIEVQDGRMYASNDVQRALETELASAPGHGAVRIGLTFRDQSGAICRSFTDPQASGLACRDRKGWQVRGLFAAPEGQSSDYRMAGGMNPNLAALIDSTMTGEPLDAAQEKAARARRWR